MVAISKLPCRITTNLNPRRSLRARLGLAIGSIAFVLSILASVIIGHTVSQQIQVDVGQSLAELAYQMTDKLDRGMFERYRDIQILSTLNVIRTPNSSVSEQRALLEKLQSTYPDYAWIGFTDRQGIVQASTGKLLEGKSVSQRPWFIEGQKAPYVGDVHEALKLASLLPNPAKEPLRFVDVAVPVTDLQGHLRGVLGAHLSWTWSQEIEKSLLNSLQRRHQEMFILRQDGTPLLGPSGFNAELQAEANQAKPLSLASVTAAQQGLNSYEIETWLDGYTYLTGFARSSGYRNYPGLGWLVLVRQQTHLAFAPVRWLQQQILLGNMALGALFAVLSWLVAERMTKPMLAIAVAADCIRQGNSRVKIPVLHGRDEIANLSKSLNSLVYTLTAQENELKFSNQQLQHKIYALQQAEELLRSSEEKFRQLAENIREVFWISDPSVNEIIYVSPAYEKIWGSTRNSFYANPNSWLDAVAIEDRQRVLAQIEKSTFRGYDIEFRIVRSDQSVRWIWSRTFPVRNVKGEIYRLVGLAQDITERKQAEAERDRLLTQLENERSYLKAVLQQMPSGVAIAEVPSGKLVLHNEEAIQLLRHPLLCSDNYQDYVQYGAFHADGQPYAPEDYPIRRSVILGKVIQQEEMNYRRGDGTWTVFSVNAAPVRAEDGQIVAAVSTFYDISKRKQAEEQIQASLKEKEVLLKEIHHRVKNNLQIISSMLSLQSAYIEDEKTLEILKTGENRVASMGLIHEQLYQSKDLAQIDFAKYIENLAANLFDSYNVDTEHITLEINVNNVYLDIDHAIPCGLIINELVSNALKYAFPSGRKGQVDINFLQDDDHHFSLVISDDGIGFPQNLNFQDTESLGLQIVNALTGQLSGQIELERNMGTKFKMTFPKIN